ncbi:MAG: NAD(P)H-dependent oxidoreductase [Alphaproteobacteria bacterium]|nr:NAD(P)H-dependent oxidoreductase [Alphaproteobacteria bacterium]
MKENDIHANLINALNWRYAVQVFDEKKKISDSDIKTILEAGRLAPSSFGLQPWKFIVITDIALRKKLVPICFNQEKITTCSHVIALAYKKNITQKDIDAYISDMAHTRNISKDSLEGFKNAIKQAVHIKKLSSLNPFRGAGGMQAWNARQTYIPLGMMIASASLLKIDSAPMEGFVAPLVNHCIGIDNEYTVCTLLALGYRSENDPYATLKKSRFSASSIIEWRKG